MAVLNQNWLFGLAGEIRKAGAFTTNSHGLNLVYSKDESNIHSNGEQNLRGGEIFLLCFLVEVCHKDSEKPNFSL